MRKALIAVIAASALFAVGAFAANLSVQSDNLASGQDVVVECGDAEVTWTTNTDVTPDTSSDTADWTLISATVTLNGANCVGASVDLAIGTSDSGDAPATDWINLPGCGETDSFGVASCSIPSADQPLVREVVDVAVLANGNAVEVANNPT